MTVTTRKRYFTFLVSLALILSMMTGCGTTATSSVSADSTSTEESAEASVSVEEKDAEAVTENVEEPEEVSVEEEASAEDEASTEMPSLSFPIAEADESLSLFYYFPPFIGEMVDDVSETSFFQQMQQLTGVTIDFQAVSLLVSDEQFQLMVASGDYTDMVYGFAGAYTPGMDNAVDDEIAVDLTPYIEAGYMPSYKYLLEEVPSRLTDVTTDEGYIAVAAQLLSDDYMPNAGMVIRQDYLDAVGMESPVTYDQWEEVLTAFKTELNVESPLNIPSTAAFFGDYIGAGFGVSTSGLGIYVVDGVVHAGAIEDGYRQWVELLHDWYSEGLIYKDFYSEDSMQTYPDTSRVLSGEIGIWFVDVDTMAEYAINAAEANSPDFHVVGVADPVQNEGDVNHLRKYSDADANLVNTGNGIVVTTACKNPELAAMWLDAHYSPEGSLIVNYGGIEGETYNYDSDGKPVMTDLIVNNPDLAFNKALSFYCAKNYVGYYEYQRVSSIHTEDQLQATAVWALADSAYGYPVNANMTADEATEYAQYSSDLETYISEHIVKFIIGAEDLSNYESFQQELRNMGIERLVELKQAAYDRYISRA